MNEFKYEVAFSFLQQDEKIAFHLNDLITDRLSTFIYSKKQELLGGKDGEKVFNKVFYEEARIVVVLFRDGWGLSTWTRIEETAIKNRAFDKGWDFLVLVNLDTTSILPKWIPRTYIWLDYVRFKSEGAAAIIEQKVSEQGGESRPETIEDRANRLKRLRLAEGEQEKFLGSKEAIQVANDEVKIIIEKLQKAKKDIEDPATHLNLATGHKDNELYEFGYNGYYLCFSYKYSCLKVTLHEKMGHHGVNYKENVTKKNTYRFDRDLIGTNGWCDFETGKKFIRTDDLINIWVKKFIDDIERRKKNSR
jgi:hypothetical protein